MPTDQQRVGGPALGELHLGFPKLVVDNRAVLPYNMLIQLKRFNSNNMATIRDIARKAKVSVGTVSNYLNTPEIVAEGTRESIRLAIQELNYHPHAAPTSLKSGLTRRIGMVPLISLQDNHSMDPGDTAFLDFLSAVNTASAENGYDVLLSAATSARQELRIYERLIGEMQVDGVILLGVRTDDPRINLLCQFNFPFISFGRTAGHQDHAYVDIDGTRGIELAVLHLVELGHSRIAYLQPPKGLMLTKQRWQGFSQAMAYSSLKIEADYVIPCNFRKVLRSRSDGAALSSSHSSHSCDRPQRYHRFRGDPRTAAARSPGWPGGFRCGL